MILLMLLRHEMIESEFSSLTPNIGISKSGRSPSNEPLLPVSSNAKPSPAPPATKFAIVSPSLATL
jgi:hypothetical protein